MSNQLVTVAAFIFPFDAYLLKMRLESCGIECFLADDSFIFLIWLFSLAIGGVKIKVRESDLEAVADVLAQEPLTTDLPEDWTFEDGTVRTCPRCNSPVVFYEMFHRRLVYASWALLAILFPYYGFPFPVLSRKWKCLMCGCRWRG